MPDQTNLMEKVVALCKRRGFIYPGSEIYGGLANTYDYGPMGAEVLRNIRNLWWDFFVHKKTDVVGLDSSLISSHKVWDASGHTSGFSDAMIDCKNCQSRYRADHVIEDFLEDPKNATKISLWTGDMSENSPGGTSKLTKEIITKVVQSKKVEGLSLEQLSELLFLLDIKCPNCKKRDWTAVRKFNLLFPVKLGIVEGDQSLAYLRGETAQGIFINFRNITDSTRVRLPFGVAQLGKSFRNEITPGNSIFRTIEFEQGEIEYFFDPEKNNWEELFNLWKEDMWTFATSKLGVRAEKLRWRAHTDEERSFYSKKTEDMEYEFPFGFKELWGLAYRGDYDLKQHIEHSGKDLSILDPMDNKKIIPHVIEPAVGINRLMLMTLVDAYTEDGERVYLKLNPNVSPYKVAVFPLLANKEDLITKAKEIFTNLSQRYLCAWDDRGNIGKRYASQDEIGTPFCITVDFDSLEDQAVTIRDRDSAAQERIKISELEKYLSDKIG